ncbi:DUF2892 domain-containing protein, partial [Anoxybacillus sp. KU2-6(11)]|uniref:YgaP family membrane protein n=1 Tax=Anoxybacillus sp. KU2-6(11) TaxID=1535751 RepID=UPI001E40A7FE
MKANVGSVDRIIRFILGIALLGLFFLEGNIKYVGILGIVLDCYGIYEILSTLRSVSDQLRRRNN